MRTTRARPQRRRAIALVTVLVVMGGAILVATSLLFVARAHLAGGAGAGDRVQARALAASGIRAAMRRLDAQRETILRGDVPALDQELLIYETGTRLGVVRLLPIGPGGERVVPEPGRLDLGHADADMLAATGTVDETLAASIIEHREAAGRPYRSVPGLLAVPGLSAETLYGPLGDWDDQEPAPGDRGGPATPRGLADVVTVHAREPALQVNGKLRINLNVPWSEQLHRRVSDRFGPEAAQTLQQIMESGTTFDSEGRIIEVLNFFEVPPAEWPEIVDTFTSEAEEVHVGRLDINTASHEALAALPGIEPEQAASIVQVRDDLGEDERATVAWPVIQGIIDREAFAELAGRITTRSWTYRLRLEAGEADAGEPGTPLDGAVIYEVVIDLSAPDARLAYAREVSWWGLAVDLLSANRAEGSERVERATPPRNRPPRSRYP